MSFIYLASPYTHSDPAVMQKRYEEALEAVVLLSNAETVYSPIVHFHNAALAFDMPKDATFWRKQNVDMLEVADNLIILTLDDWHKSVGVAFEQGYALGLKKPIYFNSLSWLRNRYGSEVPK